ncbi:MAG: transcriptional repressor NrdR [Planctomycetes bacterium]|nr:transcriptional repressor NrdR [Planctomycetota bacterium]
MRCLFCGHKRTRVVDSRDLQEGSTIRRRRRCENPACGRRFTTYEQPERVDLRVAKRDNSREPFDRQKVLNSLHLACRKRPTPEPELEGIVTRIENSLRDKFDREVPSRVIGELVMEALKALDVVAYIRFASVYRDFKEAKDFIGVLKTVRGAGAGAKGGG